MYSPVIGPLVGPAGEASHICRHRDHHVQMLLSLWLMLVLFPGLESFTSSQRFNKCCSIYRASFCHNILHHVMSTKSLDLNPLGENFNDVSFPQAYLGAASGPTDPQLEPNQLRHTRRRNIDGPPQMDATLPLHACLWPSQAMRSCIVWSSQDTMCRWHSLCNVERAAHLESM